MKPIVHIPNPVLGKSAKPVTVFDTKLTKLLTDMKEALIATVKPKGVGLAAPQIGESWRIFITKPKSSSRIRVFINPEIVKKSDDPPSHEASEGHGKLEGCLSVPNVWGHVKRTTSLVLSYQDEKGSKHEASFTGFLATIIQHETDHINGILFTQRVLEQHGKLFQMETDDEGKESLEEIKI